MNKLLNKLSIEVLYILAIFYLTIGSFFTFLILKLFDLLILLISFIKDLRSKLWNLPKYS